MEYFRLQRGVVEKKRIYEVLQVVGLANQKKKHFKAYSMGMKQRLGIALCLLGSPDCLVLDEPINGLDAEGIMEIRTLLLKLNQEKQITILVSSHILTELQILAQRFVFIKNGVVVDDVSKESLENKNRRQIKLKVNDPAKTTRLLEQKYADIDYKVLPDHTITIQNYIEEGGEMNRLLIDNGVSVMEFRTEALNLEDYFLGLVGGGWKMINYMKSEKYRLVRKKGLHIISVGCLLLITAAAAVLYYFGQHESNFPYATSLFFYSNVIAGSILILIIAFLFNLALTGKDMSLIKQSISFGISRNTIFWSKLILTLSYFLLVCIMGLLLMIGLGENLFDSEEQSLSNFLTASFNMLPIVLSSFFMVHAMKMLRVGDAYIIILLLFTFVVSGDLLRIILRSVSGLDGLYQYAPSAQLNENLMNFLGHAAQFEPHYWITGIVISVIFLLIGARRFAKQHIN